MWLLNRAHSSRQNIKNDKINNSCACIWTHEIWPKIKRKISATLEGCSLHVIQRKKSFQLLGYDVLIDETLEPWILEVNMSPAMAHRCPSQNALIANMCQGLIRLAVIPSVDVSEHSEVSLEMGDYSGCAWESLCSPEGRTGEKYNLGESNQTKSAWFSASTISSNENFIAVGTAISAKHIDQVDCACLKQEAMLLIQRLEFSCICSHLTEA